jgi:hypothetical protein
MPSPVENFSPFERLLVDLAKAGVDFAVVGGVAVSLNAVIQQHTFHAAAAEG